MVLLFLQVHVLNVFDGMAEEALAQAPEFVHRVGGKELETRKGPSFLANSRGGGKSACKRAATARAVDSAESTMLTCGGATRCSNGLSSG
jgi:hypothetical protein